MANLAAIITELETIATAQTGLNSFMYTDLADVNTFRNKTYPLLLVERQVGIAHHNLKNRQRVYSLQLHFLEPYKRLEETQTTSQEKQEDIEVLAEQFLQEFRHRYKTLANPWMVDDEEELTGTWSFNKYNDRLAQLTCQLKVRCQGDCLTGNFNY